MGKAKARGADSWTPPELQALPDSWLQALANFMVSWDKEGQWPHAIRHSIIALVPKEGAQHEKRTQTHRHLELHIQVVDVASQTFCPAVVSGHPWT